MKRRTLLSGLAAAATLAACSSTTGPGTTPSGGAGPATNAKLTYYGGWTGADLQKMQGMVDSYNKSQSVIQVEFSSQQWTNMFTKFLADMQAGTPPDVVALHTFEIGQFAAMKVFDPDAVKALNLSKADYMPIAWDGCTLNNTLYGVPIDVNMHAVYYNKDLFAKAGISAFPATKDDFVKAAQALTVDTKGNKPDSASFDAQNVATYGLGFAMNHHAFYQFFALINQMGYNPFTADMTKISIDVAKVTPAVQWLEDLIFKHKVVPVGEKSPIDDFKAGKVAMVVDGNWQLSGFGDVKFQWDTAPYPNVFGTKAVWGAAELLAFPKRSNANQIKASQEFVQWLSKNSAEWAKSGQIPANKAADSASQALPGIAAYKAELDYVKFLPAHAKATQIFSSAAPSPILTFAQDMVLNNKPAGEIVPRLEADINAVLSK